MKGLEGLVEVLADQGWRRRRLPGAPARGAFEAATLERLLTGSLAGLLDEATFQAKGTELKGEAAVERFKLRGKTRDPRSGEFEPYSLARKSLPDKEKALRLFGRRAHFEGWSGRLADL